MMQPSTSQSLQPAPGVVQEPSDDQLLYQYEAGPVPQGSGCLLLHPWHPDVSDL